MPNPITAWSEERESLLAKLWGQGNSAAQIAAELTGATRNSVLGKINRMGLSTPYVKKVSAGKPKRKTAKRSSASHDQIIMRMVRANGNSGKMRLLSATKTEQFQPRCVEVVPLHKSLLDLEPNDCRYPYGDNPFTFCALPMFQRSYCASHFYLTCGGGTTSERAAHKISRSHLEVA